MTIKELTIILKDYEDTDKVYVNKEGQLIISREQPKGRIGLEVKQ